MDDIKSAFEKAMEKVDQLAAPSEKERLEWSGVPKGQKLAAALLQGKERDPRSALAAFDEAERPYVARGAADVLSAGIQLPRHAAAEQTTGRAVEAIRTLWGDRPGVEDILGQVSYVIEQYKTHGEQQRQQAYAQLKQQFQVQIQERLRQQGAVTANQPVNVETLPEFQQEVMRLKVSLDAQYEQHLDGYRQQIRPLV